MGSFVGQECGVRLGVAQESGRALADGLVQAGDAAGSLAERGDKGGARWRRHQWHFACAASAVITYD